MTYRIPFIISCLLVTRTALGQTRYTGSVGSAAIELTLLDNASTILAGVYTYCKFNHPIALDGTLKQGTCHLVERNSHGKATAALTIAGLAATSRTVAGSWKNLATGQQLPVTLTRVWEDDGASEASRELLQVASLPNTYFRIVLTGSPAYLDQVEAVRLFDKKTNRLVQRVPVSCASQGLHSVSVGDFNFDGHPDFSVFESSYAGPNTSSLYFLFDPVTKRYVESGFTGTSLEFDGSTKRVYETNSCCAGSSVQHFTYKIVRNQMVLVAQHCLKWDEKKQALVERKPSECQ